MSDMATTTGGTAAEGEWLSVYLFFNGWIYWTPLQALQAATINPARTLGMERDLGTIEAGKLADLVVLDANPLDNIQNTDDVSQVMLGGRLYDSATLNEQVTGNRVKPPYWWERSTGAAAVRSGESAHAH